MMVLIHLMHILLDLVLMISLVNKEYNVKLDLDYYLLKLHNLHIDSIYISIYQNKFFIKII
jgi:hypothetical protein